MVPPRKNPLPAQAGPQEEAASLFVVFEPFLGSDGTVYQKGEVIHPDDPHLRLMPERFRPFAFPHPVKRSRSLTAPEIRAE